MAPSNDRSTAYASGVLSVDTAQFVVLKHHLASGRSSLYLNRLPGGAEPDSPDAVSEGMAVAEVGSFFFRSGGPTAGLFQVDTLRLGTRWEEVTPAAVPSAANQLVFVEQPMAGTAGLELARVVVQIRDADEVDVPSNRVPVLLMLSAGGFAFGTTTIHTDTNGRAIFADLGIAQPGRYSLRAEASGIGDGLAPAMSASIEVGPTNCVSEPGLALSAFLDSLQVERYWSNGVSVNWLTGAAGGSGPNLTQGTASHCSAFAAAVASLLGAYLPRPPEVSDVNLANRQAEWLRTNATGGWFALPSAAAAQQLANTGALAVAVCGEESGSGHIAVLRPSVKSDAEVLAQGPQECQSGIHNYNNTNVAAGFDQHPGAFPDRICYYGHAVTNDILPVGAELHCGFVSNRVLRFGATAIVGRAYRLLGSQDLSHWTELRSFTNANSPTTFYCSNSLVDTAGWPARFYRLMAR